MNIEVPLTLRPKRVKTLGLLLICMVLAAGGVLMGREGRPEGYLAGGFFALGLPLFALQLHPKAAFLHLSSEGFTFCSTFWSFSVPWATVQKFAVMYAGRRGFVAFDFIPQYPRDSRARILKRASKALCGYDGALPDTYGMKPQELADALNRLLQRYATSETRIR